MADVFGLDVGDPIEGDTAIAVLMIVRVLAEDGQIQHRLRAGSNGYFDKVLAVGMASALYHDTLRQEAESWPPPEGNGPP